MNTPKVTTSSRLWSEEVALARAAGEVDAIGPGAEGIAALRQPKRPDYVFSNGRTFENREYAQ